MPITESVPSRALRAARAVAASAGVVAAAALTPPIVAAQVVRGIVVDEATGRPVPGAVVVLFDSTGKRLPGVLTGDDGRYGLRTTASGRFAIRAERIGFRADAPTAVTLRPGETVELRLVTRPIPVVLSAVRVRGRTPCVARAADGREVSAVWDEARKALYATDLTQRNELFSARVSRYTRTLDPRTGRVTAYETTEGTGVTRNPFVSLAASRLSADGFIHQSAGETVYFGPDAAVLLSDEFLADHCFRLRAGEGGRAGLIGLEFEPVRGRDKPDIAGVMWIDRQSAELRDLVYTYRRVPNLPESVNSEDFGGRIEFRRMPTGAWIVERWVIRMPMLVDRGRFGGEPRSYVPGAAAPSDQRVQLAAVREEGGEVMETVARGARSATASARATVRGVVFDSTRMAPLPDARVFLDGTQFAARSAPDGAFVLDEVPEGTYAISVVHPRFDSLGMRPPSDTVRLRVGEPSVVGLASPSAATVIARECSAEARATGPSVLRGRVRDAATGGPAIDAEVRVTWNRMERSTTAGVVPVIQQSLSTRTDSSGRYDLCGIPEGVRVTARARVDDRRSAPVELLLPAQELSILDLAVGRTAAVASVEPRPVAPAPAIAAPASAKDRVIRALERRRDRGGGSFLARAQIERLRTTRVTDLLRTMPGVSVTQDGSGAPLVELRGSMRITLEPARAARSDSGAPPPNPAAAAGQMAMRRCPVAFQVDGLPMEGASAIDSDFRPEDIEAIEVYASGQVPLEFSGRNAECGLVLIWTRAYVGTSEGRTLDRNGGR
jgi:hypothetical protein